MNWLNYHHLQYFWTVARKGSVAAASSELRLAGPTISAQIRKLEDQLGGRLLRRTGNRLVLTDLGQLVLPIADEIFSLGRDITDLAHGHTRGRPLRLAVGIVDSFPKWLMYRLIEPALQLPAQIDLHCSEGRAERLLQQLVDNEIDVVLSDAPPALKGGAPQLFARPLGECGTGFYAAPRIAERYRRNFPDSLDGAPLLLMSPSSAVRGELDQWFEIEEIRPEIMGVFDAFATQRVFAEAGRGIIAAPTAVEADIERRRYRLRCVGRVESVRSRFYAVSRERKIQNAAVAAVCSVGRLDLFPASATSRRTRDGKTVP